MTWIIILSAYSILLTILYCLNRHSYLKSLENDMKELVIDAKGIKSPIERAPILLAIAELQKTTTPWYERSFSTIGVITFFSMSLAAGVQTINATQKEAHSKRLEFNLIDLRREQAEAERFVADVSNSVANRVVDSRKFSDIEQRILRYRLDRIKSNLHLNSENVREIYSLAMILKDYPQAINILENNKHLLDITAIPSRLSLAEYYFLVGSHAASREMQKDIWAGRQRLSSSLVRRLIILRTSLGFSFDDSAKELARLLNLNQGEAKRILINEKKSMEEGAKSLEKQNN